MALYQLSYVCVYLLKVMNEHKLSTQARKNLPASKFVFPKGRRYPIEDKPHARNALARVSQYGSPSEKAKVRSAVHSKYPDIGESAETEMSKLAESIVDGLLNEVTGLPYTDRGGAIPHDKEWWEAGYAAGLRNDMRNPYREGSQEWGQWQAGNDAAHHRNRARGSMPPKADVMPGGGAMQLGDTTAIGVSGGGGYAG